MDHSLSLFLYFRQLRQDLAEIFKKVNEVVDTYKFELPKVHISSKTV